MPEKIHTLPVEILNYHIFSKCNINDMLALALVNKHFSSKIKNNILWEQNFHKYFPNIYNDIISKLPNDEEIVNTFWYDAFSLICTEVFTKTKDNKKHLLRNILENNALAIEEYIKSSKSSDLSIDLNSELPSIYLIKNSGPAAKIQLTFFQTINTFRNQHNIFDSKHCAKIIRLQDHSHIFTGNLYHIAAERGSLDILNILLLTLENSNFINSTRAGGDTPIHLAIRNGHYDIVKLLIAYKANLNIRTSNKRSSFEIAATSGNVDIGKLLIEHNPGFINSDCHWDNRPIHVAVENGNIEFTEFLIENGVNINTLTKCYPETPLHIAIYNSNLYIVKMLVDCGAKLIEQSNCKLKDDALAHAVRYATKEIINYLFNLPIIRKQISEFIQSINSEFFLAEKDEKKSHRKSFSSTNAFQTYLSNKKELRFAKALLHGAIIVGDQYIVETLLDKGIDVDTKNINSQQNTALHQAVLAKNLDIVKLLLEYGANLKLLNRNNQTALAIAEIQFKQDPNSTNAEIINLLKPKFYNCALM